MEGITYKEWTTFNKKALQLVRNTLDRICKLYGIKLINDKDTYNSYLKMMYNESSNELYDDIERSHELCNNPEVI